MLKSENKHAELVTSRCSAFSRLAFSVPPDVGPRYTGTNGTNRQTRQCLGLWKNSINIQNWGINTERRNEQAVTVQT